MFSSFMINDWIAASIIAVVAGVIGFFVVLRGATFAAHALPLGTFPGAAAANLFGVPPLWGLISFAAIGVISINRLARSNRNDVATGLTLVTLLGLGTLFLSLSHHYAQGVYALLFGEVLGVSQSQIIPVAITGTIVVTLAILGLRPLLLSAVSADLAAARGAVPAWLDLFFLSLLGLATAVALPVVGALLVFSLMVGPASAAHCFTSRPGIGVLLSVALALCTVWVAIAAAYLSNWPVGFFVGLLAAVCYLTGRAKNAFNSRRLAGRA